MLDFFKFILLTHLPTSWLITLSVINQQQKNIKHNTLIGGAFYSNIWETPTHLHCLPCAVKRREPQILGFSALWGGSLVIQFNNYGTYLKKNERTAPVFHKLQIYYVENQVPTVNFETRLFQFLSEGALSRRSVLEFSVSFR